MDNPNETIPTLEPSRSTKKKVFSRLRLLSRLKDNWKYFVEALISAALLVGIVSLAVWGEYCLSNNGNIYGDPYSVWIIGVIAITSVGGIIVSIGLPILWGKSGGYKRVLGIISTELIILAIAAVIAGIVLIRQNPDIVPSPNPTPYPCDTDTNCVLPE